MSTVLDCIIGQSPAFRSALERLRTAAGCDATILIIGETGTGKEIFAKAVHSLSSRAASPFGVFDCGAVPLDLMENELFGHTEGAYTGAGAARGGLVRACEGGTLFIDEIDCLPLSSQAKLLRLIDNNQFRSLGSSRVVTADVRIVAATNSSLLSLVRLGRFRQDLYYRLNVISLKLPALRERPGDIPLLADFFLRKSAARFGKTVKGISPTAMLRLRFYNWPGNVRELEHVVERAILFSTGETIENLDFDFTDENEDEPKGLQEAKREVVAKFEREYLESLLSTYRGNVSRAALAAKTDRKSFQILLKKHAINPAVFKESDEVR